jgi:L-galactose dehydrogenase
MDPRTLGRTGLKVPRLAFGASSLGSVFRPVAEEDALETVRTAWELGLTYMDVSPYYGLTRAETLLGRGLRGLPRHRLVLSSKAGRYGADAFDFSFGRIVSSVDESLARLGTDYLDILFLHDIEFGDPAQVRDEGFAALERLRRDGKIRFGGVSGLPLPALHRAVVEGDPDVVLSYCHLCLNDTTLLTVLPDWTARGIGVVNASPLSMGLLTDAGPPDWHPAPPELKAACRKAAALCRAEGASLAQLALSFALSQEAVPTTLFSTASSAHLRESAACLDTPPDPDLLRRVREVLAPVDGMGWPSGRAESAR